MANQALIKVQYGLEAANGTAAAADTMLACTASLTADDRQIHIPAVDLGVRSNMLLSGAAVRRAHAASIALDDADGAYFQLFPVLFSCGLNGNVSPVEQNTGEGDYLWTFTAPQTGSEDVDTMTLEMGDDAGGYEVSYVLVEQLNITGDCVSGEVHVSATCSGDLVDQTTVTGGLSIPTMELCIGKLSQIYVDSSWANLGNTELADCLVNWEVSLTTGAHHKFWGSNSRTTSGHNQGYITGEATFTFERTSGVYTEEANYRPASGYAQTPRFIRLTTTGTQISSGDNQALTLDMAGLWTSWQTFGAEDNGNSLDQATLTFGYDTTGAQSFQALVTTDVSAV